MVPQVFISYTTKDLLAAEAAAGAIEKAGVGCWMAPRDLTLGEISASEIVHALGRSRVFVIIFSSRTSQSKNALLELERAQSLRTPDSAIPH